MATELQKRALDELVEDGGNKGKALVKAGYSKETAKTPQKVTESKGFKELCEKLGLTDNFLTNCLVEDIKKKPQNRKPELELGFKIKGLLAEKHDITSGGEKIGTKLGEEDLETLISIYERNKQNRVSKENNV